MSTENELVKWLSRSDKTFSENMNFAMRACKSLEFALQSKYDIIINWFCDTFNSESEVNWDLLLEFVEISYPPGLVPDTTKRRLIGVIMTVVRSKDLSTRAPIELLQKLSEHQALQIVYRSMYTDYCELQREIFESYRKYIHANSNFAPTIEDAFYSKCVKSLRNFVQSVPTSNFPKKFAKYTLAPLIETVLVMKAKNLKYYEDTFEICKTLYLLDKASNFLDCFDKQPLHVFLHCMDYAVNYYREDKDKLEEIVLLFQKTSSAPEIALKKAAHVLDLFRKYDVSLDFNMDEGKTALSVLGDYIQQSIEQNQNQHFYDVLTLVCSAIKLNPMILDKIIFQITSGFLMMPKDDREWHPYEEFLILLIDVFKKLNRAEKFVLYLWKSVKLHLQTHGLNKTLKRKIKKVNDLNESTKLLKLDDGKSKSLYSDQASVILNETLVSIVREEFTIIKNTLEIPKHSTWKYISRAWPPQTVGLQFSKFISTLMSKPSLVVWKTLLFSLSECVEQLKTSTLDGQLLVLIDFISALFCQYLAGSRLSEQTDLFWSEINNNRTLTQKVLSDFGQTLIEFEYNNRTMDAFLEICYHVGCFDLITWYYCSDSLQINSIDFQKFSRSLHGYLTHDQWASLEQRIVNFGKNNTKININRLNLQKMKARILFPENIAAALNVHTSLLPSTLNDVEQTQAIFGDATNFWLTQYLSRDEKMKLCDLLIIDHKNIDLKCFRNFHDDQEFFELIILTMYKYLTTCFESEKSTLKMLDFENICKNTKAKTVISVINTKSEHYSIKNYSVDAVRSALNTITEMPIGFCSGATKATVFALNLAVYKDVLATENADLVPLCFDVFSSLLHFGEPINVFAHFDIEMLIYTFPPSKLQEFYEFVFSSLNKLNQSIESCLSKIYDLLKTQAPLLSEDLLKLSIIVLNYLECSSKVTKKHQKKIILILVKYIKDFFSNESRKQVDDKEFVEKTLPVFPIYINFIFAKGNHDDEINEDLRKICKIYIGHSINCYNPQAIKLINVALYHRSSLHFDDDEIQFVLQEYWNQITADARTSNLQLKNVENPLKLIIDYKSNDEFRNIFIDIEKELQKENFEYACRMLTQIAGCRLNSQKGVIFNDCFKRIVFKIILDLERTSDKQFISDNILLNLLECQKALCENKKIPLSVDNMDDILTFMMDINIKHFPVNETNIKFFRMLYEALTGVCTALIRFRYLIIMDRVPQFVHVFKGLLQAICWYRCERPKDMNLDLEEIEELVELSHNLENLMHLMAIHTMEMKRVAPYLLTYTISLMVMNTRSTTLYPKIKTHIENICHELIGLCDHRVGSFILRCSNDATKQVYQTLCKEYEKYRKFKGKV